MHLALFVAFERQDVFFANKVAQFMTQSGCIHITVR
jgi:hypothetical protein